MAGIYSAHLSRWLGVFDPAQIMVLHSKDMNRDTPGVLREVAAFIGLDSSAVDWSEVAKQRFNAAPSSQRKESLSAYMVQKLRRFYDPFLRRLRAMLRNSSAITEEYWPKTLERPL